MRVRARAHVFVCVPFINNSELTLLPLNVLGPLFSPQTKTLFKLNTVACAKILTKFTVALSAVKTETPRLNGHYGQLIVSTHWVVYYPLVA